MEVYLIAQIKMKNVIYAGFMMSALTLPSQAVVVYTTDFDISYLDSTGAVTLGGGIPNVTATEWFGSSNGVGVGGGDLSFNNSADNRFRGSGVWLDTTGWATGTVTVAVDVMNYVAGDDTSIIFQAYAATGVNISNSVSLDLHANAGTGALPTATGGSSTINALGAEQMVTGNGTAVPFTFNFDGTADFVALTFVQINTNGGTDFGSADLDNLTVSTVPEPSSSALFGLGCVAFILRRRR